MTEAVIEFRKTFANRDPDRLGFAALIGVAVHLILIFGVGFASLPRPQAPPSLAVTIAVNAAEQAPEQADFLAQSHQLGGGQHPDPVEMSNDREADFSDQRITEAVPIAAALPQPQGAPVAAEVTAVVVTEGAARPSSPMLEPTIATPEHAPVPWETQTPDPEIASLRAKLDHLRRDESRRPNVLRVTSVSARAADAAVYLDYWESLVEQVGNRHYPEEARRKRIFGSLRVAVRLRSDGSVEAVEVLESSGSRVLDSAAIRTIRLAEPFSPFPPELARWDRLEIIRTWRFVPGNRLQTGVE